ncbi:Uncharacterized protein FKW44_019155, partial [Caligus rogercresseyi]
KSPVLQIRIESIRRIFRRRYLLRPLGLEMEYLNAKRRRERISHKLYHKLISVGLLQLEDSLEENMTLQWMNGLIPTMTTYSISTLPRIGALMISLILSGLEETYRGSQSGWLRGLGKGFGSTGVIAISLWISLLHPGF